MLRHGGEGARATLAAMAVSNMLVDIILEFRDDPEWSERLTQLPASA